MATGAGHVVIGLGQIPRRDVLATGLAAIALAPAARLLAAQENSEPLVNDVTRLNPVPVGRIVTPRSTSDVVALVRSWPGTISIGGARFSMGGQIAAENSLHLDMRDMNRTIWFDPDHRQVRVQTGMRWRDLQDLIDPHGLSVKIMQSYADFTIGGALSVNAHGRYVGLGPLINSVKRIQLVLSNGQAVEATTTENAELFYGAIGGYGGIGVITEAELDLASNVKMERTIRRMAREQYPAFYRSQVLGDGNAIFHNADIDPGQPRNVVSVTWSSTDKPVTIAERLRPRNGGYVLDALEIWALGELPGAHLLRRNFVEPLAYGNQAVAWRNREASLGVASLGALAGQGYCYALQEYFVPAARFEEFASRMLRLLDDNGVNALNISVRHAPADPGSMLAWAREEVFSFVLYYRQRTSVPAQLQVGTWTRQLIDAALALGGTYYLPYQLHATRDQFARAYPQAERFFSLKADVDPRNRFRNRLWEKYALAGT